MKQLSTQSTPCLIMHCLFSFKVWACWVYFSNKSEWHNERMELSWLYLIKFDQVCAQCRSNLPRSTVVSLPGRQGEADKLWSHADNLLDAPSALFMKQGLEHLQMACHFLLPSITMAICCTHWRGRGGGNLQLSLAKQEHIGLRTNRYIHR